MNRFLIQVLLGVALVGIPAGLSAQVSIGVSVALVPPALPVYEQPPIPGPGYIWRPGYWWYGPDGYYWVPGTWVTPPVAGVLWTPGYWGWSNGGYVWRAGYWGPQIGFCGGINYGFGYTGSGYEGGYWERGVFNYNRTVNNIGTTNITNVYSKNVVNNTTITNVSHNDGTGGTAAQPTPQERPQPSSSISRRLHRRPNINTRPVSTQPCLPQTITANRRLARHRTQVNSQATAWSPLQVPHPAINRPIPLSRREWRILIKPFPSRRRQNPRMMGKTLHRKPGMSMKWCTQFAFTRGSCNRKREPAQLDGSTPTSTQ